MRPLPANNGNTPLDANDMVGPALHWSGTVLDVLSFPERDQLSWEPLCARLAVGALDETELACIGTARHLGRSRRCAWHLVLHVSAAGGRWTHLYRVLPDHGGRVLVLLDAAEPGDARVRLRHRAAAAADPRAGSSGRGAGLRGCMDIGRDPPAKDAA